MDDAPSRRGLLDTSVIVRYDEVDRARLPGEIAISALTLAELTAGPHAATNDLQRAQRQHRLQRFEADIEPLPFDSECARAYGSIYVATRAVGRKPRGARALDLMIAATAFAYGLPLYTLNPKDLRGVDGLIEIVDVGR